MWCVWCAHRLVVQSSPCWWCCYALGWRSSNSRQCMHMPAAYAGCLQVRRLLGCCHVCWHVLVCWVLCGEPCVQLPELALNNYVVTPHCCRCTRGWRQQQHLHGFVSVLPAHGAASQHGTHQPAADTTDSCNKQHHRQQHYMWEQQQPASWQGGRLQHQQRQKQQWSQEQQPQHTASITAQQQQQEFAAAAYLQCRTAGVAGISCCRSASSGSCRRQPWLLLQQTCWRRCSWWVAGRPA